MVKKRKGVFVKMNEKKRGTGVGVVVKYPLPDELSRTYFFAFARSPVFSGGCFFF